MTSLQDLARAAMLRINSSYCDINGVRPDSVQAIVLHALEAAVGERDKQLEQARKDDGRLTWLQFYGTVEVDIDGAWKAVDHVTGKTGKGDSIRTAIDLASQAEKEQG